MEELQDKIEELEKENRTLQTDLDNALEKIGELEKIIDEIKYLTK